jgi:hypothetical protein
VETITRRRRRCLGGIALLTLTILAPTGLSADDRHARLEGACYCKRAGELHCFGMMTEAACNRRCADEICDDAFWLERRPCWNWGYGG